ncbi:MAG TPA: hypothetical protein VJJ20_01970 [Candidatus Paceibacterota bacterium]
MDQAQDQNQAPFPTSPEPRSGNIGPLVAAVVIVVLLAAGGFYFFYTQQQKQVTEDAQTQTTAQSDSDAQLESDLNATETSGADEDVTNLDGAL